MSRKQIYKRAEEIARTLSPEDAEVITTLLQISRHDSNMVVRKDNRIKFLESRIPTYTQDC